MALHKDMAQGAERRFTRLNIMHIIGACNWRQWPCTAARTTNCPVPILSFHIPSCHATRRLGTSMGLRGRLLPALIIWKLVRSPSWSRSLAAALVRQ
jgi:hypothetical protein